MVCKKGNFPSSSFILALVLILSSDNVLHLCYCSLIDLLVTAGMVPTSRGNQPYAIGDYGKRPKTNGTCML